MNEFNLSNQHLVYLYCSGNRQKTERKITGNDINELVFKCFQLSKNEPKYTFSVNCFVC